ncbi:MULTISPECIES: hypothetical protein [unclassified Sphingopyxis]|jgi:hypothetical protein|uniref:hypothetical protein n=1 Tax=unclassified Sphingopyxis TaxID=2614943 RepID=UPI0007303065|nr:MULTISPECIES: hypothetical protein [unclassified Sphingopyxis]KTE25813.1 hypothetical protein ATE61_08770 [Sphingopyxis sp. H057]KTE51494.1 hypothetical protein ATE64_13190 [Sphingopyxis sp. H073]KTE54005.1 hypothetical protein ATE69_11285 [Sphingopyxis sp. H071]KTE60285.1 hypothetical protein ATE66_08695 [Sphingopyxis sp. H107]KTE65628.1 hypothetical protein ATE65_08810 [Sphingopyxis sp. H100]
MDLEFTFRISGSYSPDDIPLERLGEYLKALGELFGERANVHFRSLELGSTVVRAIVDHAAVPKVEARIQCIATGNAGAALAKAYERIDALLRDDNATGEIADSSGQVIHVDFPGRKRVEPMVYGPIKQQGTLDGTVFRVEGRDSTVHVGIMDGERNYSLEAPAAMGKQLAALFRAGPIRFRGMGTWFRSGNGAWDLRKFVIDGFDELDDGPLSAAIADIRNAPASDWRTMDDPFRSLGEERDDGESTH